MLVLRLLPGEVNFIAQSFLKEIEGIRSQKVFLLGAWVVLRCDHSNCFAFEIVLTIFCSLGLRLNRPGHLKTSRTAGMVKSIGQKMARGGNVSLSYLSIGTGCNLAAQKGWLLENEILDFD